MINLKKIQTTKLLYICDNSKNMIDFKPKFSLKDYNSFGIDVTSEFFAEITSGEDINELVASDIFKHYPRLVLGGGSNILFTHNFNGLIIHPKIEVIDIIEENKKSVLLKVGSGVIWDELVEYSVSKGWGGLENLSAIPGNVGASPIQNIGAYGVEAKDVIAEVQGFDLVNNKSLTFTNASCKFAYRNSIFKRKYKNNFLVTYVIFQLKKFPHKLITNYGQINQALEKEDEQSISVMRKVICEIRNAKLPDVKNIGNAGSFFKNPVVNSEIALNLKKQYKDIPLYNSSDGGNKLSAAWLIEKAGCKGIKLGNAGSYHNQPLVLINLGNAKGKEILRLAEHIKNKVYEMFAIVLETEVNIIQKY